MFDTGGMDVKIDKTKSKRIARNSIILFVRMLVITLVNLYAVRLLLAGLGDVEYGVYNVVAGLVTVLGSLNTVLSLSIQRYYSVALGEGNHKKMSEIFSSAININLIFIFVIILFGETLGLWFVYNYLVLPAERLSAAVGCFHFSLVSFLCTFIQVPFLAAIIAKEDMSIFAWVSTIECAVRLLVAVLIPFAGVDGLVFYSGGLALTSLLILFSYVMICHSRYAECRYVAVRRGGLYKELLSFSGWTMYGSLSNVGLIQGNTLLLNVFFGPLVNVAFAVALQINNAFTVLCNTIILAFRPPMVKSYSEGNYNYVDRLFYVGNKFILYILMCVAIPMIVEMETILKVWLGYVSADVVLFSRLVIIYVICMAMNNPITAIIQAIGKVKDYHLRVDSITLLCLPLTWFLFKWGLPAYSVFYSMIGLCILAHMERLICLRKYYAPFSIRIYFKDIVLPFVPIVLCASLFAGFVHRQVDEGWLGTLLVFLCTVPFCLGMVALLGINKQERAFIQTFVKSFIKPMSW